MGVAAKLANRKLLAKVQKLTADMNVEQACEKVGITKSVYYSHFVKARAEDTNGGKPVGQRAARGYERQPSKVKVVTYDGAPQPTAAAVRPTGVGGKLALFIGDPDQVLAIFRKL